MAPLIYQQLMLPSATSRLLMGLTLCGWIKLLQRDLLAQQQQQMASIANGASGGALEEATAGGSGGSAAIQQQQQLPATAVTAAVLQLVPEQLLQRCLECLAVPSPCTPSPPSLDPYSEVLALHGRLKKELVALLGACLKVRWGTGRQKFQHTNPRPSLDLFLQVIRGPEGHNPSAYKGPWF
jgi:hypothetical protein